MIVYFVFKLRIFLTIGNTNDVCYFVLKMFVMMRNTNNVWFLCLMSFTLLYFIVI